MTDVLDDDNTPAEGEDEDQGLQPDEFDVPDEEEAVEVVPPDVLESEDDGS